MWNAWTTETASTMVQMSAEQLGQLYELMHASKDVWKPVSDKISEPNGGHKS